MNHNERVKELIIIERNVVQLGMPAPTPKLQPGHSGQPRSGVTVIELLVVVAVLGVLLSIGFVSLRPSAVRVAANSFKGLLQEARTESIKMNRPVSVVWQANEGAFVAREEAGNATTCNTAAREVTRLGLAEYRGVVAETTMGGDGVLWLPNGRFRPCSGTELASETTFSDAARSASVIMSVGGRLTIQ